MTLTRCLPHTLLLPPVLTLLFLALCCGSRAWPLDCVTAKCHGNLANAKVVHPPVQEGECEICHVDTGAQHPSKKGGDFRLADPIPALCYQCHETFSSKSSVHTAVTSGACLECHDVHGSNKTAMLKYENRPVELCYKCHERSSYEAFKQRHGPSSGGYCMVCHDPHASDHSPILKMPPKELCFFCHTDFEKRYKKARYVHAPIESKSCTACHDPHGSDHDKFIKGTMIDLCISCHEDIQGETVRARHRHKALYLGKRCGNCHDIHFSENKALLHGDEMELCLSCHDKVDTKRSNPIRNIKKELAGKKYLHGPLRQKRCIPCHNPHGSRYERLLRGRYPSTFYANYTPGTYDFCWKCHDKAILNFSYKGPSTGFSNGKENLHYLHVKKRLKGRTCGACHAPHASNWPRLINDTGAPFGEWKIPIRYKKTQTGGSCVPGCHREIAYDRAHPVDYNLDEDAFFMGRRAR